MRQKVNSMNETIKTKGTEHSGALLSKLIVAAALCCIALVLGASLRSNVFHPLAPQLDSSVFQYIGIAMTKGQVPYLDTFDHKGPVIFFLNYFGKLIGDNGVWFFELLLLLLTTVCVYRIMRKFCGRGVSVIGTAAAEFFLYDFLGGGNYTEEYALPFITCALLIFVDYFLTGKTTRIRIAVCGACFMMVALLRANMVATWVVFPVAVLVKELRAKNRRVWGYLLFFLIGAAVAFLPFLIYFAYHHALRDFWEQYGLFNLAYSGTTWSERIHAMWHFFWNAPTFLVFAICFAGLLCGKEQKLYGLSMIYLLVSLAAIGMAGREYNHYGIILMPLTVVPLALALRFLEERVQGRTLLLSGILVALFLFYPWWQTIQSLPYRTLPEQTTEGAISTYIRSITDEDETIIVCGHKDVFYVLSGRMAASKYSYPLPIAMIKPSVYDEFFDDLYENPPAVLITDTFTEEDQLDYTELNARTEAFLAAYPYDEGKTIETYTLYTLDRAYRQASR